MLISPVAKQQHKEKNAVQLLGSLSSLVTSVKLCVRPEHLEQKNSEPPRLSLQGKISFYLSLNRSGLQSN